MVPENLERHLQLNAGRLKNCDVRVDIDSYVKIVYWQDCEDEKRVKWHPAQVPATVQWTLTLWSKAHPRAKAEGKVKEMACNRRAKEKVELIQSLMEHVTIVVHKKARQATVGTKPVHPGTREAKSRTARAIKQDLWTMLDRRKNPKQRRDYLSLVARSTSMLSVLCGKFDHELFSIIFLCTICINVGLSITNFELVV